MTTPVQLKGEKENSSTPPHDNQQKQEGFKLVSEKLLLQRNRHGDEEKWGLEGRIFGCDAKKCAKMFLDNGLKLSYRDVYAQYADTTELIKCTLFAPARQSLPNQRTMLEELMRLVKENDDKVTPSIIQQALNKEQAPNLDHATSKIGEPAIEQKERAK